MNEPMPSITGEIHLCCKTLIGAGTVALLALLVSCGGPGAPDGGTIGGGSGTTNTEADITISTEDDVDPNVPGQTLVYTLTISNAGPSDATNVVITDTLPAGVTMKSTSGCLEDPNGVPTCSIGDIAAGTSAQFTISVSIDIGTSGTITNVASVTSETVDPDASNNTFSEDTGLVLSNTVIGTQQFDILRAPSRLFESAMGNMVTDAMRLKYPGVDGAFTNSGGLRADIHCNPPSAGEQPCEITWGEMFAVHPFGNRTVILSLTGAQLEQAFENGFSPYCDLAFAGGTGRFPQVSGLRVTFTCSGTTPVVTGMWKTPSGIGGPETLIGPTDAVRLITNDFMFTGGDGYTVFAQGTNIQHPGDGLLKAAIEYINVTSPVGPVVEGRIIGQ